MNMFSERGGDSFFNLLDNFKLGVDLISVYFCSFVGILAFSILLNVLTRLIRSEGVRDFRFSRSKIRVEIWEKVDRGLSNFGVSRLSAIGIFALFFSLFIWLTTLFITNNIKTNKVVRLTQGIIKKQ